MTAQDILKQYFGYDSFRPGQDELVRAILSGRDTLGIMPTGAGKSICYQVPAMLFPGLTLVISPLISLMKDQVGALVEAGVPAACINSAMSAEEFRDALYFAGRGQYKLLYVAPERLTAPSFLEFAKRVPISMKRTVSLNGDRIFVQATSKSSTFSPNCLSGRSFPRLRQPQQLRFVTTLCRHSVCANPSSRPPVLTVQICILLSNSRPPRA